MINVDGYYDHLLRWLDDAVEGGFLAADERTLLQVGPEPGVVLDALAAFVREVAAGGPDATLGLKLENGNVSP